MFVPFIVGLLAVFLTCLTRNKQNGAGLKMAFFSIFVFLALRYDYGNDYMGYLDGFIEIASYNTYFQTTERWEAGWIFLHILFKPFGFFALVGFTSLATCVVMYRFIRNYVPAGYQWLAVFLYVFNADLILVPASAMRQQMSILLFLIGVEFLYKKRVIIYLLLACAAVTFHKSAIILPPLVLLAYINFNINKIVAIFIAMMYALLFFFGQTIFSYAAPYLSDLFPEYAKDYLYGGGMTLNSGLGLVFAMFQLGVILYFAGVEFAPHTESQEREDIYPLLAEQEIDLPPTDPYAVFLNVAARRLLFKLAIIAYLVTPFALQVRMLGRMNMFFALATIAIFPIILYTTKNRILYLMLLLSLLPYTLLTYYMFFLLPVWREKFGTYHTIFSAPQWY